VLAHQVKFSSEASKLNVFNAAFKSNPMPLVN